jgi:hypothetical protein
LVCRAMAMNSCQRASPTILLLRRAQKHRSLGHRDEDSRILLQACGLRLHGVRGTSCVTEDRLVSIPGSRPGGRSLRLEPDALFHLLRCAALPALARRRVWRIRNGHLAIFPMLCCSAGLAASCRDECIIYGYLLSWIIFPAPKLSTARHHHSNLGSSPIDPAGVFDIACAGFC